MLLFCNTVACTILRLPCKQHANFSIVREGFILKGSAIDNIEGLTYIECKIECFKNDRCKSINMEQHHGGMCQLNSKSTVEMAGGMNALVPKQNWTYTSTDYNEHLIGLNCQKQKPCRDGQICKDICHCPGYQCLPGLKSCIVAQTKGYKASGIYRISNSAFAAGWVTIKHRDRGNLTYHALYGKFEIGSESDGYRLTIGGYSGNAGDSLLYHNNMKFSTYDRDNDVSGRNCAEMYKSGWWYTRCHRSNLNGLYPTLPLKSSSQLWSYMSWYRLNGDYGTITYSEIKLRL
eukprot:gene19237-21165_t